MTESVAFPQDRTCPFQPAPGYQPLAEQRPISPITLYNGRQAWAVTGYALTRQLLCDPRISSDRTNPEWPMVSAAAAVEFTDTQKKVIKLLTALVGVDGAPHRARRKLVQAGFTIRRTDALRPRIQEIVDEKLDAMIEHGGPADLIAMYASPVPLMSLCALLGIPHEDQDFFERKAHQILFGPDAGGAYDELMGYLVGLIEHRQEQEQQDAGECFLDDLLAARDAKGDVDYEEVLQALLIVLVTGHDTTSSSIGLGTFTLLQNPERLAELRADPSLIPSAVDELTRLVAVPDGLQRVAAADIEVEGVTIREGEGVFFLFSLINRDEDVYDEPESLDWNRPDFRDHLTYGFGAHQCVGQNLARAIMEIAYQSLLERLPGLRLAVPAEEIPIKPGEAFQGMVELPVVW